MSAPVLYAFHAETGLYLGTTQADPSPLEQDTWLYPAYTTDQVPPTAAQNQAAVFQADAWQLVPDWRGHGYWLADGSFNTIEQLNVEPPADALDTPPQEPNPPLAILQKQATDAIDSAAGAARARFITTVPGQDITYQIKADQADAYVAAGRPADTSAYPMLEAEATARGMSVSDLADEVRITRDAWIAKASQIEGARMAGKAAIEACTAVDPASPTDAEAQTVADAQKTAETNLEAIT